MKKYTQDYYYNKIKEALPESNFIFNSYTGAEDPCTITCLLCNRTYDYSKARLIFRRSHRGNKNVCRYCENNDWTKQQRAAENKAKFMLKEKQTIQLIGNLASWGSHEKTLWKCLKCNHIFNRSPYIMFNLGALTCPWCETHPYIYTEQMIKEQVKDLWGDEYEVLQVNGINRDKGNGSRRILVCHNKCGFKYEVNQYHFMHGQGCPKCKISHGEWKVRKYLEKHNFYFQEQYQIHTSSNRYLKLDFYLEENNHAYAIEYNGIQHYKPIDWFGGESGYQEQLIRDKDKAQYCKENNIQLIVISYNDESIINSEQLTQRLRGQVTEEYPSRTDENIV